MATITSPNPPSEKSLKMCGKLSTMPTKFGKRDGTSLFQLKNGRADQAIPADQLIDLKFLTDQERLIIEKVIQKDLKLRRGILWSLKQSIEDGQQLESKQETTKRDEQPLICNYCSQPVKTICTRVLGDKCTNCGSFLCKKCSGEKFKGRPPLCLTCSKQRLLKLQTLDYESLLHYGQRVPTTDASNMKNHNFAESELIKKSLQASGPSKSVRISADTANKTIRSSSLTPGMGEGKKQSRSSSALSSRQDDIGGPLRRSRSASFPKSPSTQKIPSIDDADCGFTLISKTSDESLVDLCSVYSEQCYLDVEITGKILLGVWYRNDEKRLYVRCVRAEKLASPADGSLDPYVKTYLLPGIFKSNKRKTGLQYETTKPVWNEILKYADLTQEQVSSRTLWVSVWDWNRYGRQQFLGEVYLPLSSCDLTNPKDQWYTLQDRDPTKIVSAIDEVDAPDSMGRLLLGLKFEPYSPETLRRKKPADTEDELFGVLHVMVKQAEGLPPMEVNNRTDAFARCYLLPNQLLGGKKKSKVVEDSLNPVWEDELTYTYVSLQELEIDRALEVTIWDFDRRGSNQFIGGVKIGPDPSDILNPYDWMDSIESEASHWESMLSKPGQWVEAWHILRSTMDSLHEVKKRSEGSLSSVSLPRGAADADTVSSPTPQASTPAIDAMKVMTLPTKLEPLEEKKLTVNIRRPVKGKYKISGKVLIGVKHSNGYLFVTVKKAQGLTGVNKDKTSNPFVKIYLLPDRSKASKGKTEVKKKTVSPVYNETFKYKVLKRDLPKRTVWMTVWNWDRLGSNSFIGETCIALGGAKLRYTSERWYELHDFTETGVIMAAPDGHSPNTKSRTHTRHASFDSSRKRASLVKQNSLLEAPLEQPTEAPLEQPLPSKEAPLKQPPPPKGFPPLEEPPKEEDEKSDSGTPIKIAQTVNNIDAMQIPIVTVEDVDIN